MGAHRKNSIGNKVPKATASGATGGPATGAGVIYQANYSVLRLLQFITDFLSQPFRDFEIQIEVRAISKDGAVTRWDLGIETDRELIEAKLNPSTEDVSEFIARAKSQAGIDDRQCVLVYGKANGRRLLSLKHLVRIARESGANPEKFESLVKLEDVSESDLLLEDLGANALSLLNIMKLMDLSESSLSDEIDVYSRLLAGPDCAGRLRNALFARVINAMPGRSRISVRTLTQELADQGIRLTAIPNITLHDLDTTVRTVLEVLSVCDRGVPAEVLANTVSVSVGALEAAFAAANLRHSLLIDDGLWRLAPSPTPVPKANPELCESALRHLLAFIGRHKYHVDGRRQVRNALALAQVCIPERPQEVARIFIVLDKAVKNIGDKELVWKAAQLAITAARRATPRRREEAEGEAQAMICGESWVLQRVSRLDEALISAKRSLQLGKDIGWDRNTAFCEKCIGRLYRLMAEATADVSERDRLIRASIEQLQTAIRLFSASSEFGPTHPEVGDCYSLLGRTSLVGGNTEQAQEYVLKASELITEQRTKDYLDLMILQGEVLERSNRESASAYYDEVLEQETKDDLEKSEIVARAYFRRAINSAALNHSDSARGDLDKAAALWDSLGEPENAAQARWTKFQLDGAIPKGALRLISHESATVRAGVIQAHQERLAQVGSKRVARRAEPGTEYWVALIKAARSQIAVESRQW